MGLHRKRPVRKKMILDQKNVPLCGRQNMCRQPYNKKMNCLLSSENLMLLDTLSKQGQY